MILKFTIRSMPIVIWMPLETIQWLAGQVQSLL